MSEEYIKDFATGRDLLNTGSEANRQKVEAYLVNGKGFSKEDIIVDHDVDLEIGDETYSTQIDLIVTIDGVKFMAVKCAAASLASREREIVAASRIIEPEYQIPLSVVSDGDTALVFDTVSGNQAGEGMDAIPSREEACQSLKEMTLTPLAGKKIEKTKIIFRSYDTLNVNVSRTKKD